MDGINRYHPTHHVDGAMFGSKRNRIEDKPNSSLSPGVAENSVCGVRSWRLNRKIDIALLPFLSTLHLSNGLDRSNIGNAETQGTLCAHEEFPPTHRFSGFNIAIGATPDDLNLAVSLFFVISVLLQSPSAAIGRWFGAKY